MPVHIFHLRNSESGHKFLCSQLEVCGQVDKHVEQYPLHHSSRTLLLTIQINRIFHHSYGPLFPMILMILWCNILIFLYSQRNDICFSPDSINTHPTSNWNSALRPPPTAKYRWYTMRCTLTNGFHQSFLVWHAPQYPAYPQGMTIWQKTWPGIQMQEIWHLV